MREAQPGAQLRHIAMLRLVLLLAVFPGAACAKEVGEGAPRRTASDPTAREYAAPALRRAKLLVPDSFGGQHVLSVEVAESEPARQRGLMWRERLLDGQGMLFVFPGSSEHSFWMANTLISLDLLFVDEDWKIVGILEALTPGSREARSVGVPSRYVVEVPAGWVARSGIRAGALLQPEGV